MKAFWVVLALAAVMGLGYLVSTGMARKVREDLDAAQQQVAKESASIERRVQDAVAAAEKPVEPPASKVADSKSPVSKNPEHKNPEHKAPAPAPASTTPAASAPGENAKEPAAPEFEIADGTVVKKPDGSYLIDDRFVVKGEGTSESPFVASWELLLTSQPTFDPKAKKRKIPKGVAMLDGKVVRLAGFVAFPLNVQQPRELLSMLNQWDGCCIGVPPTPYDAVEVRLKKPVAGDARFATSGTVQGIFRVKPYTVGDWLVGLYMMDGATLEAREYGGFGK